MKVNQTKTVICNGYHEEQVTLRGIDKALIIRALEEIGEYETAGIIDALNVGESQEI